MSRITVQLAGSLCAAAMLLPAVPAKASDALLQMSRIDVETDLGIKMPPLLDADGNPRKDSEGAVIMQDAPVKTIFRSHLDKSQFYYLPSNVRFAKGPDGAPMFTLLKFNLAYSNGNWVQLVDKKKSDEEKRNENEVFQGGVLKATFTCGLYPGELKQMQDALRGYLNAKGDPSAKAFKLGRFPLDTASFIVALTDPTKKDSKVVLGPFGAPLTDDIMSVMVPLSTSATDILLPLFQDGGFADAPVDFAMTMRYSGFDVPYEVSVKGDWSQVYKSSDTKVEAKANYWFFESNASYQKKKQEIAQDSKIEIVISGKPDDAKVDDIKDRVMDQIMKAVMDTSTIKPMPEDGLAEGEGKAGNRPEGQTLFGKPVGVSVGFAMKQVDKRQTGSINFNQKGFKIIESLDYRYAKLDFGIRKGTEKRHLQEVNSSGWEVATPGVEFAVDLEPWFVSNKATMTWPSKAGPQTREAKGDGNLGKSLAFGTFNFKDNKGSPVVPFTYECVFNGSPAALEKAGVNVTGVETKGSLATATAIYRSLYGPTILIPMNNDYSRQPSALINESSIAVKPQLAKVKYEIISPENEPSLTFGATGNVGIQSVVLTQEVSSDIPVVQKDGSIRMVPKKGTGTISLSSIKAEGDWFETQSQDLYLFPAPAAKFTISYTVTAGRAAGRPRSKKIENQPYVPDTTVKVDLMELFPDLAPKANAAN